MNIIKNIKAKAKKKPKKIIFPEALEKRTLKAVGIILKQKIAKPILIGNEKEILKKAKKLKVNLKGAEIIDNKKSKKLNYYAKELFKLRKKKGITLNQAKKLLNEEIYFGTMAVKLGDAHGLISGAVHTTAHTLRPAFQIIKAKVKASGAFLIIHKNKEYIFADCAVIPNPDSKELAQIAIDSAKSYKEFTGKTPYVAMLSFSTKGSASHEIVDKVRNAVKIVKGKSGFKIDGEMQLDAAIIEKVAKIKCPKSKIAGKANVLIFPDLNSGNIGYKLVERFGGAKAIGPIIQGLKKPVNDLSRGCSVSDIVDLTAITAL